MLIKQDSLESPLGMGCNATQFPFGMRCNISKDLAQVGLDYWWANHSLHFICDQAHSYVSHVYYMGHVKCVHRVTYGHLLFVWYNTMDSQTDHIEDTSCLYACICMMWYGDSLVVEAMSISSMSWDCELAVSTSFAIPRWIADICQPLFLWSLSKPNKLQLSTCARTSIIHKRVSPLSPHLHAA
jgi:hypothetical protein